MNQPSEFQNKYPLSPRKFWKKLITGGTMLIFFFLFFFVGLLGVVFAAILEMNKSTDLSGLFVILAFSLLVICLFFYAIYIKIYIKRYYYDYGDQFITIKKGVFAPTEIHVQYQKIQDVYVDQDVLDKIMGLYDVHVSSATVTSGIEAHIDGVNVDVAEGLKNMILSKIQNSNAVQSSSGL